MTISLRGVPEPRLVQDIIEAMTLKDTAFFCDTPSCQSFKNVILPYLLKKRKKNQPLKIWSAACSTGQEPYSLAISILEHGQIPHWKVDILATDIAGPALEHAKQAKYSQIDVQRGISVQLLLKHGTQQGRYWQLNDNVRALVQFEKFNILDDMEPLGELDAIFCRNVLCYFEEETKKDILSRMAACLPPDGFLFLGETESLPKNTKFKAVENTPGLYILRDGAYKENALAKLVAQ